MPARVAINKSIELAIQLVAGLDSRRGALESAVDGVGHARRRLHARQPRGPAAPAGRGPRRQPRLLRPAGRLRAPHAGSRSRSAGDIVVPDRRYTAGDPDHYPFYSTYQAVDLVCYPPEHEGFGNQAIEAVWARLPLAVFEYPVFAALRARARPALHLARRRVAARPASTTSAACTSCSDDILDRAVGESHRGARRPRPGARWTEENERALRAFCGIDVVADQYIALYA